MATRKMGDAARPRNKGQDEAEETLAAEPKQRINFNVPQSVYNDFRARLQDVSVKEGRAVQQTDILTPLIQAWIDGKVTVDPIHSRKR